MMWRGQVVMLLGQTRGPFGEPQWEVLTSVGSVEEVDDWELDPAGT